LSTAKPILRIVKQAIRTREEQVIHPVRLAIATALFLAAGLGFAPAQSSSTSGGSVDPGLIEDLVAANRILAEEGVLDAYGHVSIRHPSNPNRYLMSRSLAPALVSASDIMEYDLDSPIRSIRKIAAA